MTASQIEYDIVQTQPFGFLGVLKQTGTAPEAISAGMSQAFDELAAFIADHEVAPTAPPLAIYYDYNEDHTTWVAGFPASDADLAKADGAVQALRAPGGKVLTHLYKGPYSGLKTVYDALMAQMASDGLRMAGPAWEVYLNDPDQTPEQDLETRINLKIV